MTTTRYSPSRLREAREAAGVTQTQAAEEAGVSRTTLQHYEYGEFEPQLSTALELARLYGVGIDSFLDHEPEPDTGSDGRGEKDRPAPTAGKR